MAAVPAPPAPAEVPCPHCRFALDRATMPSGIVLCPRCRRSFEIVLFAPPERRVRVAEVAEAGPGGATACAVHKRNVAVGNCSRCGIFVCSVCKVEADRRVLCPPCFDRLSAEGALDSVRTKYRDYSGMTLSTALVGLLLWPFGIVLGPLTIYYGIKALQQKEELGESGGRFGIWAGMALGVFEAAGGLFFILSLLR